MAGNALNLSYQLPYKPVHIQTVFVSCRHFQLQFVAGLVVIAYSFLAGCDHPTEWRILMATYLGSLFVLFSMFYVGKYKPTKRSKKE